MRVFTPALLASVTVSAAAPAPQPGVLKFNERLDQLPSLSLSGSVGEQSKPPLPFFGRGNPAPPRITPGRKAPALPASSMPIVAPDASVDYKIVAVPPDPNTDFKIRNPLMDDDAKK